MVGINDARCVFRLVDAHSFLYNGGETRGFHSIHQESRSQGQQSQSQSHLRFALLALKIVSWYQV